MENNLKITAYLKTHCGWSEGVRSLFRKYGLAYEEKDVTQEPEFRREMERKSGQRLTPCVEVNGTMLADVSGQEVEAWMVEQGLLARSDEAADAPLDRCCSDEQHAAKRQAAREQHAARCRTEG